MMPHERGGKSSPPSHGDEGDTVVISPCGVKSISNSSSSSPSSSSSWAVLLVDGTPHVFVRHRRCCRLCLRRRTTHAATNKAMATPITATVITKPALEVTVSQSLPFVCDGHSQAVAYASSMASSFAVMVRQVPPLWQSNPHKVVLLLLLLASWCCREPTFRNRRCCIMGGGKERCWSAIVVCIVWLRVAHT